MELPAERSPLSLGRSRDSFLHNLLGNLGLPVALAVAALIILPLIQRVHIAEYDEAVLLDAARSVVRTGLPLRSIGVAGIPLLDHTPLYPFLLSLYAPAEGDSLLVARAVTAIAGLLCIVLTYKIGVRVGGRGAGFLAALFAALSPFLAVYSYFIRMEIFMVAAMLTTIYLLIRRRPLSTVDLLLAGCALAVGFLFKEFAVVLALPAALYVWLTTHGPLRQRSLAALSLVGPLVVAIAGWALWAWTLWPASLVPALKRWLHSAAGGALTDPRMMVGWSAWSRQLVQDLFRPGLLLGLLAALLARALPHGKRVAAEEALLWGYLVAAVGVSYLMRLREPRHLVAVIPVAAILAGQGLVSLHRAVQPASRLVRLGLTALTIALLGLASPWEPFRPLAGSPADSALTPVYRARLEDNDRFYGPLAQTGVELERISSPSDVVVVAHQGPVVAYYADRHYLMLYTLTEPAIRKALAQARYLVWDTPTWLALPADRVPVVKALVAAEFELIQQVGETPPFIEIHERIQ